MHLNYRKVCKITTSPPASLLIKGQCPEQTTVKYYEMAYWAYLAPPPSPPPPQNKTKQKGVGSKEDARKLTNDRAANWAPEVAFSPLLARSRRQMTFQFCC